MPVALDIDKEAVRVLVVAIGARAAARELGLDENTVLQWSARGGWLEKVRPTQALPLSMQPKAVITVIGEPVKAPAEALAAILADHERQTKLSLARTARTNAAEAELAGLAGAGDALSTGKLAALVHGWSSGPATTVNVAIALRLEPE